MTKTKPNFGWGHININVRNLDRSIQFYSDLGFNIVIPGIPYLGLEKNVEKKIIPPPSAKALGLNQGTEGRACIMELDSGFPKIDLTELSASDQHEPLNNSDLGIVRICLITEDLHSSITYLKSKGVELVSEPEIGHDALAELAICKDPDGTLIEILQTHPEKWERYLN